MACRIRIGLVHYKSVTAKAALGLGPRGDADVVIIVKLVILLTALGRVRSDPTPVEQLALVRGRQQRVLVDAREHRDDQRRERERVRRIDRALGDGVRPASA